MLAVPGVPDLQQVYLRVSVTFFLTNKEKKSIRKSWLGLGLVLSLGVII